MVRWIIYVEAITVLHRIATNLKVGRQVILIPVDHLGLDLQPFGCGRVRHMLRCFGEGRHTFVLSMSIDFRNEGHDCRRGEAIVEMFQLIHALNIVLHRW